MFAVGDTIRLSTNICYFLQIYNNFISPKFFNYSLFIIHLF